MTTRALQKLSWQIMKSVFRKLFTQL